MLPKIVYTVDSRNKRQMVEATFIGVRAAMDMFRLANRNTSLWEADTSL